MLIGLLANGNLLIESLPGLAKTRAVKTLAKNLAADLSRVQFHAGPVAVGRNRRRNLSSD
jgi:MoxR-like ATPase